MYKKDIQEIIDKLAFERKLSYAEQQYIAELLAEAKIHAPERFLPENGTCWLHGPSGNATIYFVQNSRAAQQVDKEGFLVNPKSVEDFNGTWSYQRVLL